MHAERGTAPARLLRVLPPGESIELAAADARSAILDAYRLDSPEHLRLTMVSTLDGRAAGSDGTSESLTSRVDRTVLGAIRELSDAVLVGAETLRREPRLLPRSRALAVLSASGRLGPVGERPVEEHPVGERPPARPAAAGSASPPPPLLVVTSREGARRVAVERPEAEAIVLPTDSAGHLALPEVVAALRERGLRRIAAEGGPRLADGLLRAGLVDELCLTLMPLLGGASLPLLGAVPQKGSAVGDAHPAALSRLRLVSLLADEEGALYGRWSTR